MMTWLSSALTLPFAIFVIGGAQPAHWDWQLTEPLDLSVRVSLLITDMDGVSLEDVADLKARDVKPICYISVGTREEYREDAAAFPSETIGKALGNWPDEVYIDIRQPQIMQIMHARIDRCAAMGFVGMEGDNIDLHDSESGFPITEGDTVKYVRELARYAHRKGLIFGQKNAPELIPDLVEDADFLLLEQCFEYEFCKDAKPYLDAGKDVLAVEYSAANLDWDKICDQGNALGLHLLLKDREVTAGGKACSKN